MFNFLFIFSSGMVSVVCGLMDRKSPVSPFSPLPFSNFLPALAFLDVFQYLAKSFFFFGLSYMYIILHFNSDVQQITKMKSWCGTMHVVYFLLD
jgi:hypothetical protein